MLGKLQGSNWRIKQYHTLFIEVYKTKNARGSSYIPLPEKYIHSNYSLINIKNDDLECFRWCMKYHQSDKQKNGDRISVLEKSGR